MIVLVKTRDRRESGNASALERDNAMTIHRIVSNGTRCALILLGRQKSNRARFYPEVHVNLWEQASGGAAVGGAAATTY